MIIGSDGHWGGKRTEYRAHRLVSNGRVGEGEHKKVNWTWLPFSLQTMLNVSLLL